MEQRNLLLAIVLSVGILIGFQFLIDKFQLVTPTPAPAPTQTATPSTTAPSTTTPGQSTPATSVPTPATREAALAGQQRIKIETPRLHGSISAKGGRIDDLTLATYRETVDPKSPEVVLLSPAGTKDPYFAQFGWVAATPETKVPGPDTIWTSTDTILRPGQPVTLTWDNSTGLVFTRTISVDDKYMFVVKDEVRNAGGEGVNLAPYALISRGGTLPSTGYIISHEGLTGYLGNSPIVSGAWLFSDPDTYHSLKEKPRNYGGTSGWIGFTDKYWLTALVSPENQKVDAKFRFTGDANFERYQAEFSGQPLAIPPERSASNSFRLFAGAKEVDLLDAYAEAGVPHFDLAIDFGWFYFLTKPIFKALQYFGVLLGNFGLAILLLTLLIKIAFFPLANKSYQAMSKMKLLQPEMLKIREQFADDKPRQQQEMMAMYKRVGANPLAGCLPIIVQIPVFFALYKVLFVTIEMRHAPFYGWIKDLSAPDPTSFVNLFGLLPFTPPELLVVGAWPLIMGVTMYLQQKLNPQPMDPVQARMFMMLPIVFTYMLAAFPAGLVIYWAWNNLLSIAQQWTIMHRAGAA